MSIQATGDGAGQVFNDGPADGVEAAPPGAAQAAPGAPPARSAPPAQARGPGAGPAPLGRFGIANVGGSLAAADGASAKFAAGELAASLSATLDAQAAPPAGTPLTMGHFRSLSVPIRQQLRDGIEAAVPGAFAGKTVDRPSDYSFRWEVKSADPNAAGVAPGVDATVELQGEWLILTKKGPDGATTTSTAGVGGLAGDDPASAGAYLERFGAALRGLLDGTAAAPPPGGGIDPMTAVKTLSGELQEQFWGGLAHEMKWAWKDKYPNLGGDYEVRLDSREKPEWDLVRDVSRMGIRGGNSRVGTFALEGQRLTFSVEQTRWEGNQPVKETVTKSADLGGLRGTDQGAVMEYIKRFGAAVRTLRDAT